MTDKQEDFPALGQVEEKKVQQHASSNIATNGIAKPEDSKAQGDASAGGTDKSKLKLGGRTFKGRTFTPKVKPTPQPSINYYIPHEEPGFKDQDFFPTLGGEVPKENTENETQLKHEEFLGRHEMFKPYISLIPKEIWFVPQEFVDEFGYPVMAFLNDLYTYLWSTYNVFFTESGGWATNAETVMSTLGELWQHAEWRDRIIAKEQKEMEEWERKYKEWEDEFGEEEEDGYGLEDADAFSGKNKSKKKKNKKGGKKPPPPKPVSEMSYKRFDKKKDDTVIQKPKTNFKDVSEITFEEQLVEVDETRQPSSLVFIGHVDVGKSTICGNLMYMSGMVDDRTIEKFKQEAKEKNRDSWWLAYVMDINDDEKAKGKTVEVGRATLETATKRFTIFDAPGHKNYVPDMIMGAAMADTAALVISARKGEYESGFERDGQTREHAQLAKSLGVEILIVVVNKMDEDSVKWDEARFNEIVDGVTPFLVDQCGFKRQNVTFIPISGLTGDNIDVVGSRSPWYKGPSLLQALDETELPKRDPYAPLRIPILDKMKERGIVAFGKVESGTVRIGSKLTVMPNDTHCQVIGIYNCKQELVKYATPGENVQIKVRMIEDESLISKGDVLCPFDKKAPITQLFEAELTILELLAHRQIMTPGYRAMMHLHTIGDEISIKSLKGAYELDGNGEEYLKKNIKYCKSGTK
jgi:peptide chain release factor subunit 3